MPPEKKCRRSIIDDLFRDSLFSETEPSFNKPIEGGYSVSVAQTPEGTKVKAKLAKDADANAFKKQLQQQYPNAQIEIEGGKQEPLIKEISTRTLKKEKRQHKSETQ